MPFRHHTHWVTTGSTSNVRQTHTGIQTVTVHELKAADCSRYVCRTGNGKCSVFLALGMSNTWQSADSVQNRSQPTQQQVCPFHFVSDYCYTFFSARTPYQSLACAVAAEHIAARLICVYIIVVTCSWSCNGILTSVAVRGVCSWVSCSSSRSISASMSNSSSTSLCESYSSNNINHNWSKYFRLLLKTLAKRNSEQYTQFSCRCTI